MTIAIEISKLTHDAIIELFVIDATVLGGTVMHLHAGTNKLSQSVVWQGQAYDPFPIVAEGFERNSSGPFPRPTLKVSNVYGLVGALVRDLKGLKGAKVIRKRTLAKFLDAVNFPGAVNPTADPSAHYPDDMWFIDRRASADRSVVVFELASPMDVAGVMLPRRQVLANVCVWAYRGADCGYTGPAVAKADDTFTSVLAQDACGHRLSSCRLRTWPNNELPFSGFPGAGSIQAL
jgi:lambda family phage minor tail protein L